MSRADEIVVYPELGASMVSFLQRIKGRADTQVRPYGNGIKGTVPPLLIVVNTDGSRTALTSRVGSSVNLVRVGSQDEAVIKWQSDESRERQAAPHGPVK